MEIAPPPPSPIIGTSSFLPNIDRTMGEYLAANGVCTLTFSEAQKFGRVTYFFNGNRTGKFDENLFQ
jgi:bisphosphoglycerate-independent phosphoglycerate mutase (AlkP superfamily)